MAPIVITAQFLELDSDDVSSFLKKATLEVSATKQDSTTMTSLGWETNVKGLKSGNLGLEFVDDFTDEQIDEIVWNLFAASGSTPFTLRQTQSAVGTSNPELVGAINMLEYKAGAGVGELAMKSLSLPTTGQVQRLTA